MAGRACQPRQFQACGHPYLAHHGVAGSRTAELCILPDDAATELNFLQKVGGGYVFVHRYLLEHFAEIAVAQGIVATSMDADH